jgi:hypothetical protein
MSCFTVKTARKGGAPGPGAEAGGGALQPNNNAAPSGIDRRIVRILSLDFATWRQSTLASAGGGSR